MFTDINLLDVPNIKKIKLRCISWENLFKDKTILYGALCDLLLNEENLLYYASQKESSKTLVETRQFVRKLLKSGNLYRAIDDIFNGIGWNKEINISNTIFQGDIAEYLMSILLDKITNVETLISKISFKTSPQMPVYGNDNVYYDFDSDTLYFGESKFYSSVDAALKQAEISIKKHSTIEEISFVRNHTSSFIAENGEKRLKVIEKFEENYIDNINIKSIMFIVNDDVFAKEDYETILLKRYVEIERVKEISSEIIFVFLPILSKSEFLTYFVGRLNDAKKS